MSFYIQAGKPRYQQVVDMDKIGLSEAVEAVFPLYTENAILTWNYVSIPMSYKYDISYMLEDILKIISTMRSTPDGDMVIHWLPDTFRCDWMIRWENAMVQIVSKWDCTVGHLETILNEKNTVSMRCEDFENEWKEILRVVIEGLEYCGCNDWNILGMKKLYQIYGDINDFGILYK